MSTIAVLESPRTTPSPCLHYVSSHGGGEGKAYMYTARSFDTAGEIRGVTGRPYAPSVPRRYLRHARTHAYTRGCFLSHSTSRRLKRQRTKMKSLSSRERTGCCSPPHLSPNGTDARQPARHHRALTRAMFSPLLSISVSEGGFKLGEKAGEFGVVVASRGWRKSNA